jgi:hypothetical protein
VADNLMGCIFSSVVLDYVFDYCYALTAFGRARREGMTQIVILYVILCKYVLRKSVIFAILCLFWHVDDNEFLFISIQNNISP